MKRRLMAAFSAAVVMASALVASTILPAAAAPTLPPGFTMSVVASGLVQPTSARFLPDGRMLVTEKRGTIRVVQDGTLQPGFVADLQSEVNNYWDRGLTGVTIDPSFSTNGFVYLFYPVDRDGTDASGPTVQRLTRITLSGNSMVPGSEVTILGSVTSAGCASVVPDCMPNDYYSHTADTVAFAPDGTLFVSMGDSASFDYVDDLALRALDVNQYPGKVLHIDVNGKGLPSNPFWDGNPNSIRSRVYASGFRNPFRMSILSQTAIVVGDVGDSSTEEVDNIVPGGSYGWPCYEGTVVDAGYQSKPTCQALYAQGAGAVKNPIYSYDHDGQGSAIVISTPVPDTSNFPPAYKGGIFVADYARSFIRFLHLDASGNALGGAVDFATAADGPVDMRFAPDGSMIYTSINNGEIRKIAYTGAVVNTQPISYLPTVGTPVNGWGPFERNTANGEAAAGDGFPISIAGTTYALGIGTHAAADISWAVPAGCTSFTAQVGVDDETGGRGSVQLEVWNGTAARLYQSPVKRGGEAATAVNVPIAGVATLRLVTTNAGDGISYDHGDWGDAAFQCGSGTTGPPVISNVTATPTTNGATVTWSTSTPSSSRVEYGPLTSYGSSTTLDSALVTSHSQTITGLATATTYHYRVRSTDSTGQEAIGNDATFTTGSTSTQSTIAVSTLPTTGTPVNGWGPFERDRSNGENGAADGGPITIGGTTYPSGLGVHAASDISFAVPGGCSTFTAQVGVDGEVGGSGSVVFEVWNGTTTRLYQSIVKRGGEAATAVSVPLAGATTLRLVVTDSGDGKSNDHGDWGAATLLCGSSNTPTATITAPADHQAFKVGDTIQLIGSGTNPDGSAIPLASLSWQVDILHCPFGGACHTHPLATLTGASPPPSLLAPDHGDDSHLQVTLTATATSGATATSSRQLEFQTVPLTLTTNPPGLQLLYGGVPVNTPFTANAVVGGTRTIEAPTSQSGATFTGWSDGGAAQHNITVGTAASTLTASYSGGSSTINVSGLSTVGTPVNGWGPFERNRSNGENGAADGGPITIGGTTYALGLGVHAASDISFAVPGGCSTFTAQVGVDGEVGGSGSVVFEVWNGTTTRLYQSIVKHGGEAATAVSVPIGGVGTLRLVVTDSGDGKSNDHGDWATPTFQCGTVTPPAPPVISAVTATPGSTTAAVTWTTDTSASSRVEYGLTTGYGSSTTNDPTLVTSHSQSLSGLTPSTTYHYRVRSTDASAQETLSPDKTFTTTASSGTTTIQVSTLPTIGTPINGWGPFERDRSNGENGATDGHPLNIGPTLYATGLGVHAASDLSFAIPAGCTSFAAQVGIDGEVGANGSVVFEVWNGTTTRLYQSVLKRGGQAATAVSVAVTPGTTLRLVVTDGGDGRSNDHGDWGDAKLTCST